MPAVLRLGLFYVALFIGSGASLPFIPVWFHAHGVGATELSIILSFPYFARTVAGPALALWADTFRLRRTPMIWLAGGATLAYAAIAAWHGFAWWLMTWFIGSLFLSMLSPLSDVITLRQARAHGFAYGLPRGLGSLAYVMGNLGMGVVLSLTAPGSVLVWTVSAAAVTTVAARWLLPSIEVHDGGARPSGRELLAGLGELLRRPTFMLAMAAIGLIQASHGFYYSFSVLLWRQQGLGAWTGALWGFAVTAEVVFMWFAEPWRRRLGPQKLLIVGGVGATVRWCLFSAPLPLWALFAGQTLHALSFTATFLASLGLIEQLSPPRSASAAQTLNSAVSGGLLIGLTTVISGPLFDRFAQGGYLAMAATAAAGVLAALALMRAMGRAGGEPPRPSPSMG